MKSLALASVLALSTAAFASDSAIYDIQYLPKAGTNFGITDFNLVSSKYEGKQGTGDIDFDGWNISQTIGRSLTDRLSLNLAFNYADVEADPEGSSKFDFQHGFSDLNLNARFRVMDEAFRFDIIGGVRASLGDLEIDEDSNYNNYSGQHGVNLGAQFGQKSESLQWAVLARYDYNFEGDIDLDDSETDTLNPYSAFLVQADMLNKLAEKSYLRSFVSANFEGLREMEDPKTTFFAPRTTYTIGTQYQHACTENLLLKGGLAYNIINQDSAYNDSFTGWNYTVGANYQF